MKSLFFIGLGGFFGAISRYYISLFVNRIFSHHIPFGTMAVNFLGSFIIGVLFHILATNSNSDLKLFLTTGFLGALTTFSTFSIETIILFEHNFTYGIVNILFNVIGSLFFAYLGYKIF